MPVCEICGSKLKNPKSKSHVNSKKHLAALKKMGKPVSTPIKPSSAATITTSVPAAGFARRLGLLEKQVKFIMEKLDAIDMRLSTANSTATELLDLEPIKKKVIKLIPRGETATIDELVSARSLRDQGWNIVEKAILELVDDEVFDVAEGNSRIKIAGSIGRLIRR